MVVASSKFGEDVEVGTAAKKAGIPAGSMGLKCGPKTMTLNAVTIAASKTIISNGPMGFFFEMVSFEAGTIMMMENIIATSPTRNPAHIHSSIVNNVYPKIRWSAIF